MFFNPDSRIKVGGYMPVRWPLEEVGQPYGIRLVSFNAMKGATHREIHLFEHIPSYGEGECLGIKICKCAEVRGHCGAE